LPPTRPIDEAETSESESGYAAALADLKEQLKFHLAEVERQQSAKPRNLRPTVGEVDILIDKLNAVIEELEIHRPKPSKKGKPRRKKK